MFKKLLILFGVLFPQTLVAQTAIDTLTAELDKITVVAYQSNRSLLETPGSISYLKPELISGFDNSSLVFGLNTVAGVRMEERANGSYRISIRGSSLRSPFGVRNVKVYWNGIPFTEPTGTTFINLLSPSNMQEMEIIKGPSGSMYGAGNGGTLLINSTAPFLNDQVSAKASVGSFGVFRYDLAYNDKVDNGHLSFKFSDHTSDGYRDQSFFDREILEVSGQTEYMEGRGIQISMFYSDLNYGIPGGLNQNQFDDDPTQARPGNNFALGSIDANSSIHHESFLFGATHTFQITDRFYNETSAFGTFSDFENPFNFDYKVDSRKSGGIRSLYLYENELNEIDYKISLGTELQVSNYAARNFENDTSSIGDLNFDDELGVRSILVFLNTQVDLTNEWYLTAGLSYNSLLYDINRLYDTDTPGEGQLVEKSFDPQLIPRIGIAKKLTSHITAHSSISLGFSPPTIEEIRTNEGSINLNLEPERGINYEVGIRGSTLEGRFGFDATLFLFKLDDTIVRQANPDTTRDTPVFRNTGETDQHGLEISTNFLAIDRVDGFLRRLQLDLSYTYHNFEFVNYSTDRGDFSGNQLTGVPRHNLFGSFIFSTGPGFYGNLSYRFTDEMPLEDNNSVFSDAYHLVQTKIGIKKTVFKNMETDIHFGVDNLLDQQYSLGYDINTQDRGSRYFQPAPERNWFLGVGINYSIKN